MIFIAKPKNFEFNYKRINNIGTHFNGNKKLSARTKGAAAKISHGTSEPQHLFSSSSKHHFGRQQSDDLRVSGRGSFDFDNENPSATLTCEVSDVFPLPEITMYRLSNDQSENPQVLPQIDQIINRNTHSGSYNVSVISEIRDHELKDKYSSDSHVFECFMILNDGTSKQFQQKKQIIYFSGE